jgi:hypothetical protein
MFFWIISVDIPLCKGKISRARHSNPPRELKSSSGDQHLASGNGVDAALPFDIAKCESRGAEAHASGEGIHGRNATIDGKLKKSGFYVHASATRGPSYSGRNYLGRELLSFSSICYKC